MYYDINKVIEQKIVIPRKSFHSISFEMIFKVEIYFIKLNLSPSLQQFFFMVNRLNFALLLGKTRQQTKMLPPFCTPIKKNFSDKLCNVKKRAQHFVVKKQKGCREFTY